MIPRPTHLRTLIVVLVLPLLVAALGMWALAGRVDRLDTVPAAVVNLDAGAEVEGADGESQTVPFGRLLAGALTRPGTVEGQDAPETTGFDWRLTSQEDAEQGLADGEYAAVVVIPEDFSSHLATLGTEEAEQAIVEVTTDDAAGQLNALVGTAVAEAAADTMGGQLAQQYLDQLYLGFNDLGEGFTEAADGAGELADGTSELEDGAQDLADGTRELADGTATAAEGAREFSGGVWQLADASRQAADGTGALADGLDELATGAEELADGAQALDQGMQGTEEQPGLLDGANQLAAGIEGDGTAQNPGLAAGADQLADGLEQFAGGVRTTGTVVSGDGTAQNPGLVATARDVAGGTEQLGQGAQQLADGTAELSTGAESVAEGTQALANAVNGEREVKVPQMVADAQAVQNVLCAVDPDSESCAQATRLLESVGTASTIVNGGENTSGLLAGTQGVAEGARTASAGAQELADGINGTEQQPGLVAGTEGLVAYSEGLQTAFAGDGTAANPGLTASAEQLAAGARSSADGADQLVAGVTGLRDGLDQYADGVHELAGGADQLAAGARASADGADELAGGTDQLADGATELGEGSDQLAAGSEELAEGTGELADGTDELAEGTGQLADGTDELAEGLREGAESVPSYSPEERETMSAMAADPVGTEADRLHEADGADTATFPFVTALALWLGAFGTFLLYPALSRRLLDRAMPMWQVVLRSLLPALAIAVVQTVAVLAVLTAVGIAPVSPLTVGVVSLAGALMFAALHQGLLTVLGERIGRIASIVLMVLQVVTLVGIVPIGTAPELLQSLGSLLPLSIVTQGLVHSALGGSLVSTSGTLLSILAWALISLVLSLVASRRARFAGVSLPSSAAPAAA